MRLPTVGYANDIDRTKYFIQTRPPPQITNRMLSTHPDEQSVNAGVDGRVCLRFLESSDRYLHKPAFTNLCA
jgi:hypothetical protein